MIVSIRLKIALRQRVRGPTGLIQCRLAAMARRRAAHSGCALIAASVDKKAPGGHTKSDDKRAVLSPR